MQANPVLLRGGSIQVLSGESETFETKQENVSAEQAPVIENKAENISDVKQVTPTGKSTLKLILEAMAGILKAIFN